MHLTRDALLAAVAALALHAPPALAQAFPERPLQLLVPFPAGAPVDALARAFALALEKQVNQRVVVMNRDGASTTLAMNALLAAPADGHTIVYGPVTALTVHLHWMKGLQYKADSFVPLCQTFENVFFLAASATSPVKDWNALAALARSKPGGVTYAHPGIASSPHLAVAELLQRAGVPGTDIPFRGEAALAPQLREGGVDAAVVTTGFIETQNLRPLVVFAERRSAAFPDTPTAAELGFPVLPSGYGGLFVRTGTPAPIVARLEQACQATVADRGFQDMAKRFHQQADHLDRAQFTARLQADARTKEELLKTLKLERQ